MRRPVRPGGTRRTVSIRQTASPFADVRARRRGPSSDLAPSASRQGMTRGFEISDAGERGRWSPGPPAGYPPGGDHGSWPRRDCGSDSPVPPLKRRRRQTIDRERRSARLLVSPGQLVLDPVQTDAPCAPATFGFVRELDQFLRKINRIAGRCLQRRAGGKTAFLGAVELENRTPQRHVLENLFILSLFFIQERLWRLIIRLLMTLAFVQIPQYRSGCLRASMWLQCKGELR